MRRGVKDKIQWFLWMTHLFFLKSHPHLLGFISKNRVQGPSVDLLCHVKMFVIAIHFISYISCTLETALDFHWPICCVILKVIYQGFYHNLFLTRRFSIGRKQKWVYWWESKWILTSIIFQGLSWQAGWVYYVLMFIILILLILTWETVFSVLFWRTCSCMYHWNHFRLVPTGLATWKTWFLFIHHSTLQIFIGCISHQIIWTTTLNPKTWNSLLRLHQERKLINL